MAKKKKYIPLADLLGHKKNANVQSLFNHEAFYDEVGQTMSQGLDQELLFQEEKRKNEREAQALLDSYREESDFGPIQEKEFQAVYKAMEEDIEVAEALQQLEKQEKYAPKTQMEALVANTVTPEENEYYKDLKEEWNKLHQKTLSGRTDFIRKQNREEVNKNFGNKPFYGEGVTSADRRWQVAKLLTEGGNFLGELISIPVAYFTGDRLTEEEDERYEQLNKTIGEIEKPIYEAHQTEMQNKIDQTKQKYGIRTKNYLERLGTVYSGGLNASGSSLYTSDQIDGEDLANVVKALDYLEDAKDLWDRGIDNRTQSNFRKIWSGLSYNGDNFLSLGLKDMSRDLGTAFAVGDGEEPLSETEELRLNSYKDLESAKGSVIDPDDWFGIAQGFQETVGFILEMQASMGTTSVAKNLLKKGGKEYANKTIEKLIGESVENSLLKNIGSAVVNSTLMSNTYDVAANTYLGENVQRITNDEGEQILVINNAQRVAEAKRLSNTRDVIDERIAHYSSELSNPDLDNEQKKAIKTELDNLTRIKLQLDNEYEQLVNKDGSIKTNIGAGGALAEGIISTASEFVVEKYVGRWVDDKIMPAIGSRLGKVPGAGRVGQTYRNLSSKVGESVRKTEAGTLTQAIWHSIKPGQLIQSPIGEVAEEMAIQFIPTIYGDYRDQMDELASSTFYKNVLISTLGLTGGRSVLQTIGAGKDILSMTPEEKESYIKNLRARGEAKVFYNKIDNMDDRQLAQDIAMNTYGTFFHPSDVLARVANLRNPNKNPGDGTTAEERNKMASNIEKTSFINLALKAVQTGTEKDLVNTLKRQMNKSGVSPETKENMQRAIDKVNKYSAILANNANLFNGDTISNLEINRDMINESIADINRELSSLDTDLAWEDVTQFFRDANLPLEVNSIEELFKSPLGMLVPSEGYQNADTMKVLDLLYVRDNLLPSSLKEVNDQLKYQKDPANREAIKKDREKKRKEAEEKANEEIKTEAVQEVVTTTPPVFVVEEEPVVTEGTEFAYEGQTYTYHENGSMTDSEGNVVEEDLQAEIMAGSSGNIMTAEEYQELVEFSKEATPEFNEYEKALYEEEVPEIKEGEEHLYFAAEANETPVTERQKQAAQNYIDDIKRRTGKDPNFEDIIIDFIEMAGKERAELLFNGMEKVHRAMGMNTSSAANVYEKYFNVVSNVIDAYSENVVSDKQNNTGKDPKQVQASTVKGETEVKKITTPQRKFKPEVNEIEPELGEDRRTVNPTLKLAYNFQDVTFDEETQTFSLNSRNLKPVDENDVVSNRFILDSDFMHKVRQEPNSLKVQVWDNPEHPMENTTWGALKERASKELSQEEYQEWYADNVPMVVVYTGKESNSQPIALSAVHRTSWYRPAVISDRNGLEEQQRVIEEGIANTRALRQQVLQTGSLPINLKFKAENSFGQLQFIPEGTTPLSLNESNPDSTIAVFMPDGTFKTDKTNFFEGTVVNAAEAIKSFQPYELVHINQVGTNSDGSPIYFAFQTMNNSPVATHANLKKPLDSKVHNTLRSVLIASTLLNNRNIPSVVSVIERVYGMTLSKALEIQNEVKKAGYNIVNTDAEPSRTGKDLSAYLNLYTMTSHQGGFSQVINDGSKQNGLTFFNRNADGSISYVKKGQTTLFSTGVNRQQTFNLRNHNNINHILNGLAGLLDENVGALSAIKMHVNLSGLTDTKGKSLPVFDNNHNLQEHQTLDSIYKDYLRTNVVSHPIETINGETKYITDVQPMFYFEPVAQEASEVELSLKNNTPIEIYPNTKIKTTVFHGGKVDKFTTTGSTATANVKGKTLRKAGIYFTTERELAEGYAGYREDGEVYEVAVNIQNPYYIKNNEIELAQELTEEQIKELEAQGYDGIIWEDGSEVIAFKEEQVTILNKKNDTNAQPTPQQKQQKSNEAQQIAEIEKRRQEEKNRKVINKKGIFEQQQEFENNLKENQEIPDYSKVGAKYNEGSDVIATFRDETSESFKGEPYMAVVRVIKPAIIENGKLIQAAQIEVGRFDSKESADNWYATIKEREVKVLKQLEDEIDTKYDAEIAALEAQVTPGQGQQSAQAVTDIYGNNHSVSTGDIITYQTEAGPLRYILNEEGDMVMLREQPLAETINTVQGKIDAINSSSLTPEQKNIAIGIIRGLSKNNTEYGSAERFSADEFASLNTNRIDSLTNEEQKQVVEAVKNLIINSIDFNSALKYSDIKNSIENGVDRFVQEQISQNKEIREILRSIPGSQSILNDIDTVNSKLEKVLEQKEKLIGLNGSLINEFNNIFNANFYEDAESINEESENYSQSLLEKDVKLSYGAFLKMSFFGFPKDMNNGTNKNTFGFTNYHSADLVNNKLLDISTRVNSSWNTLMDALSDMGEKTKQSLYQEMSRRFESLPEHLKNELLYNTIGRKNTIYKVLNKQGKKVTVKDETGAEYFVIENFEIGVLDENSSRDTVRMFEQVKSDFNSSKIVKNVQGNLFIDVEKAKEVHAKFRQAQIDRNLDKDYLKSLLAEIGITSFSDQTFDYIIDQSANVPSRGIYGNSGLITQITKHLGYIAKGNKDVSFENYSFIDQISGVIKNTVNVEVMLNKTFMGGSIYVGGKTMQSFIANTSVYDINHKLSTDESYLQMLQNIPSLRNNFLLKFLMDNPQFREMYGEIGFSSPEAYKVDNKDVPDNADFDKIAEQDNLATVLGLFTYTKGAELSENTLGNHPDLTFRRGRLPVHTISDKGRMIYIPTVLLDMQEGDITSTGDRFTLGEPVLNFLKEQLFDSELNRILQSYQQDTNIVAYDKSSKVFTLIPSMNSIKVVTENGVTLDIHDVLAETVEGTIKPEYMEQIEAQAKQRIEDYINHEVDSKLTAGGTGLLRDLDFYDDTVPDKYAVKNIDSKYVNKKPGSNSIEKLRFTMAEFAINNILHNNNVQQMYLGDLAFYSKDSFIPTKMVNGQVRIDGEQMSKPEVYGNIMIKIGSNLQKRTALLIAPGKKLANSQDPSSTYAQNYVHIALNDTESMSSTMKELIEAQYGLFDEARNTAWSRIEYYKNKIKELENDDTPLNRRLIKNMNKRIKSLVAENFSDISDYFNITGTDAQEYLTWQTHLDILLRQGRITRDQHDSFKNKIESEELTTEELDIILQPIKPVHTGMIHDKVNNIMRPIYIKSSSFPLLPQLTKNLKIDSLREAMEKVEKERKLPVHASYQSANKIGALKTQLSLEDFVSGDYANNLETGITVLPYSDYKIQQETPSKEMKNFLKGKDSHVVMGSQFFKILFGNFINHDTRPIFPNRFSKEILKLAGIEGNKENLTGAELYNIYQNIYFEYSDTLKNQLENELGLQGVSFIDETTANQNIIIERLKNILEKEITNRNYPDYLKDSIQLVQEGLKMELESVMMFDNNRYKFESLLQAVISNRLITHTLPGNGHISASSNGFERKAELDSLSETEKGGIIWLNGIPRELKATIVTRADGKKVLTKSEVLIKAHWKYYDSEGNFKYVDLSDPKYSKDIIEDGKVVGRKLNTDMIDKELLEMFSYRIPTSSHQSGAVIEVAGFLPSEMQDLLVVPKEHTTQFGEDYDIDKRQVYKYNYIVNREGKIEKLNETHADNFRNYYPTVQEQKEMLYEEFQGYLQELKDEKSALKDLLNNESWYSEESSRHLFGLITAFDTDREELLNAIRTTNSEIASLYEALSYEQEQAFDNIGQRIRNSMLRKMKIQLLENGLIDTYNSLYTTLDSSVQQKIFKPLVTDTADKVANAMQEFLNSEQDYTNFNILSDNYQRYLLKMGADGKGGIGVHSNAVVLEAQMQRLPVQDKVNIDYFFVNSDGDVIRRPFADSIGNLQFEGNLGQKAKTLDGGRDISDQHGENQNVSTDNISKQIMGKRNENSYTMSVYAFMAHMGFDLSLDNINSGGKDLGQLHIPSLMLNQPVLRDYTRIRQKYESMTAPYTSDQETAIVEELAALYGYPFDADMYSLTKAIVEESEYNLESSTLTGQKLFDNLKQSNALKNPLMQMVILQKFLKYQSKARELSEVQQLINLSTSKLGISFFEVNQRVNKLNEIADLQMEAEESGLVGNNYTKLIGEFTDVPTEGYTKVGKYYWKPTTVEGKMFINSISTANNIMPALFPYDRPTISNMINAIFAVKDLDPNVKSASNLKLKYDIMSNFVNFVNSDSNIYNNLENERKRLFFDTDENQSLGSILKELRRTNNPIMQNSLLDALTTNLDLATGIMEIKHTLDEQTTLDKSTKYEDFKDLLKDDTVLGVFNGEELKVSDLAQDLISYSLLSNDRNGALGFKNYIPVDFFKIVGDNRKNRNLFNNILHSIEGEDLANTMENFVKQFFQHNPDKASTMSFPNFKTLQDEIKRGEPVRRPRFVSVSNTSKSTSLKQFDLYEFDEVSNSYKPISILGSKGMLNEFNFKESNRESLLAANNPGRVSTNGYLPGRGNNIQAKSLDLALQRFTTANQIAEILLKTPENYRLKTLLQQILPFIGDSVQVVFVEPNQVKGVAAYSVNEKVIKISKNFYETLNDFHKGNFQQAKERARNILIEEIIHSITVEEVSKYVSSNPVTGEVLVSENAPAYVRGLVTAYEIARSKVPYDSNNPVSTYGSSNFIEFIANVFTNDSYRQNLEKESTGFIKEFLKAVRNMFKYLQQQATGTYPKYDDIIFQDLLSLLQNDRGVQTTPVDSKKNVLAQMRNNNPVVGTNRSLQKQNPVGFYKGLPIINTTEIINAEGQRGAAQYDGVNKLIKVNKPFLQQKYQEKAWTKMRELVETIHGEGGERTVTSKAQDLPENQFQNYDQFEKFVIEHEFQRSIYTRQDFNREFPQGTKGDYETEINKRAIFALGLGIPLDIDKNDLKCN